jgi:putative transposase
MVLKDERIAMKKSTYTEAQIALAVKQAETGTRMDEVCRKKTWPYPLSLNTLHAPASASRRERYVKELSWSQFEFYRCLISVSKHTSTYHLY